MAFQLPKAARLLENPSPEELQQMASGMPSARWTKYGNVNVQTKVLARSTLSTFIVTDDADSGLVRTVSRAQAQECVDRQDDYIAGREMILLDGYLGAQPEFRVPVRLFIEAANANIAGMQQQLWFPVDDPDGFEPELTVVYTPNLPAPGWPDERLILVDLDQGVNRVFNSDYFGESKKGILRMWNKLVYDRGGIPLHAGCKVIPTERGERVAMIVGLSGTGKTTTTFTRQNGSLPVQDDFVAWMPDGAVYATENGCFAKTYGLNPEDEPTIYGAVTQPRSYLENVSQTGDEVDFYDESYTKNGRATFGFEVIESAATRPIDEAHFLLILNRNEGIIPAVAKLEGPQAAAFFMLGETTGTAAGGAAEEGKFLRVPGTNPFFPLPHDLQGNRFLELLADHPLGVYLMSTGRVGGPDSDERSRKVRIKHSSAIVKGIAESTIEWQLDPDFGYQIASHVPGIEGEDEAVLRPRELYEAQGRLDEYERQVERLHRERREFLSDFESLSAEIVDAVG
jgi:phosphoenolpyruvate carboxykinase (ATP)